MQLTLNHLSLMFCKQQQMHNCFDTDLCGSGECEKLSQALDFEREQNCIRRFASDDLISIALCNRRAGIDMLLKFHVNRDWMLNGFTVD